MNGSLIDPRVKLSIELALTATLDDPVLRLNQDELASVLGMTGAEVDAARGGSSFDVKTSLAVSLALNACEETRRRAERAGISDAYCAEIEEFATTLRLSSSSTKEDPSRS